MTSAVAMYAYLLHREQMNHETNIHKWQKEKELVKQLKKTIIKILKWELSEDLKNLFDDEDD